MSADQFGVARLADFVPPGLADDLFARGDVPMTKAEVRAATMAAARLRPGERVLDVGAGTGSLTVEAALLCQPGEVVAVERDPAALELLHTNLARFGLSGVTVVAGEAPAAIAGLAAFDAIFVGGSGGSRGDPGCPACLLRPAGRLTPQHRLSGDDDDRDDALRRPPWSLLPVLKSASPAAWRLGPCCASRRSTRCG